MPQRETKFIQGGYYHVYNRGVGRQSIFKAAINYEFVLRKMKKYAAEYNISVIAYCLMPNHYHWLLRQDGDIAAGLMAQHAFNSYTKAFNKMYRRSGTLFEGRFKAKPVENETYLKHLCRYIHANPIKDGLTNSLDEWPYSNYPEWMGSRSGTLVDHDFVDGLFSDRRRYRQFVQSYLRDQRLPEGLRYLESL